MGIALAWFVRCSPPPTGLLLPLTPPDSFSLSGEQARSARWWTSFADDRLNALMKQALDSNFNVLAAWQRFQAAEAVADREASFLLPDVEAFFSAGRSYPEPDFRGGENQQLGLSVAYEVDLWGRDSHPRAGRTLPRRSFAARLSDGNALSFGRNCPNLVPPDGPVGSAGTHPGTGSNEREYS